MTWCAFECFKLFGVRAKLHVASLLESHSKCILIFVTSDRKGNQALIFKSVILFRLFKAFSSVIFFGVL